MKSILPNRSEKKPQSKTPAAVNSTATGEPPKTPPKFTPRGGNKTRILVAIKDDRIDFDSMGAETSKALNDLLHKPEVQKQFGIGPLTEGFDPRHCKRIYQALGTVMMGFGKLAFKWPTEAIVKLQYTDAEQEELAKPTAAVLDELAPTWLREHQALAALLLVFGAMTQNKMREAQAVAIEIAKQRRAGAPGPQPVPMTNAPAAEPVRSRVPIDPKVNGKAEDHATEFPSSFSGSGGLAPRQ